MLHGRGRILVALLVLAPVGFAGCKSKRAGPSRKTTSMTGLPPFMPDQCFGWKVHPSIGGKLEPANLQVFSMSVYQHLMGQLHRQVKLGR